MKNRSQWCLFLLPVALVNAGCGGDDSTVESGDSGGQQDAPSDGAGKDARADAAKGGDANEAGASTPERVLVTLNDDVTSTSQLVAVNVATKKVDGRLTFPGFIGATDAHSTLFPFLLEQSNDAVARLDDVRPWIIDSSWNVALHDETDGGFPYTDPSGVIVGAGNKAYVLRYNRNEIAVIDTSQTVDAGTPTGTIDLSSLLQSGGDGTVEMAAGVYVAAKNMLYVVLGNINQNMVVDDDLLCTSTVSTVIGIDTTNDKIANIGSGPGGSIPLRGFDPVAGGLVYDSANDRLLLLEAGCNAPPSSDAGLDAGSDAGSEAGPGAISKRGVESVKLADGSTQILLDASQSGFPSSFVYVDATHAVLGFDFTGSEVYKWDPTQSKLGALIPHAPDSFTFDGVANLLGTATTFASDGGSSTSVVSVDIDTGKSTTLITDPFTLSGGFIGGVDVWPHP